MSTMNDTLPSLPEPTGDYVVPFYTADQMRDYARAALAQRRKPRTEAQPLPLKRLERLIYEHTKLNPNMADDRELLGYIVNAARAIENAHGIGGEGKA